MNTKIRVLLFLGVCVVAILPQAFATPTANAFSDKRFALVVGNSAYAGATLKNPRNDAAAVSRALVDSGFDVKTILDLRRVDLLRELRTFAERLKADRTVGVLYFAGHGMQARGKNFLIPVDSDIRTEEEIEEQAVDVQFILDRIASSRGSSVILILDACRNNPFVRSTG